jgi:hypothetical protein
MKPFRVGTLKIAVGMAVPFTAVKLGAPKRGQLTR